MYFGRRGLTQLVHEIASAFARSTNADFYLALSRQNEDYTDFLTLGDRLLTFDTFSGSVGAAAFWRARRLSREVRQFVIDNQISAVINLMPHIWSSKLVGGIKSAGASYLTVVHDARPHPGDITALAFFFLRRDIIAASGIITLSRTVTSQLVAQKLVAPDKILTLFHPLVGTSHPVRRAAPEAGQPWRFLFLGRIMAYKGLPIFVATMEKLRELGHSIEVSVMGEGSLSAVEKRLKQLGAVIVNKWLSPEEIADAFSTHHAIVLSHVEASQSGVLASAQAAGLPVIACPVGGIVDQIRADETGVVSSEASSNSLTNASIRLMKEPGLYVNILENLALIKPHESADAFAQAIIEHVTSLLPRHT